MALKRDLIGALEKKAASGSVRVEHLVRVALEGEAADASRLRTLSKKYAWPNVSEGDDEHRTVPLGMWAETVSTYLEHGQQGVLELARSRPDSGDICIGLIEEIQSPQSVEVLLCYRPDVINEPSVDLRLSIQLATAFNRQLSFGKPTVDVAITTQVRDFLHRLLAQNLSRSEQATCVCALRGAGDASSLPLIEKLGPFTGNWAGLDKAAIKQIKSRIGKR